jgi:hypothetical protein
MLTMVYVVTYRLDNKSPQEEQIKYTREAANILANSVLELGGIAIVTEDIRTSPDPINDEFNLPEPKKGLVWEEGDIDNA